MYYCLSGSSVARVCPGATIQRFWAIDGGRGVRVGGRAQQRGNWPKFSDLGTNLTATEWVGRGERRKINMTCRPHVY
jgi:hypothetical protein